MTSTNMRTLADYHFLKLDPQTHENPYPFFKRLRAEAPVYRESDFGVFLVSKYNDIVAASGKPQVFSSINNTTGPFAPLPASVDELEHYRQSEPNSDKLFSNDPPGHTPYRHLVAPLFARARVSRIEPRIREHVEMLFEGTNGEGQIEFVSSVGNVLPLLVVGEVLGVSPEDNARFHVIFKEFFEKMESYPGNPDAPARTPHRDVLEPFFAVELEERRRAPRQDIMSELANATFPSGQEVPLDELIRLCAFLYAAGGEANTPQLLINGTKILAQNPSLFKELQADPSLVELFVDETLRMETSAMGLFRLARSDSEIGGIPIAKGDTIMLLYASGNHDEEVFESPEEFRLQRPKRRVLSFGGFGPHTCPGASLARLEAKAVFQAMLERFDEIEIATEASSLRYVDSCLLRSPRELKIAYKSRR